MEQGKSNTVNIFVIQSKLKNRSNSALYKDLERINFNAAITQKDSGIKPKELRSKKLQRNFNIALKVNALFKKDPRNPRKIGRMNIYQTQYETFQNAMKITLVIGQILGLSLISPSFEKNMSKTRVVGYVCRYIHSLFICIYTATATCICFYEVLNTPLFLFMLAQFFYYLSTFLTCLVFFRLARKWPSLMKLLSQPGLDKYVDPCIKIKCCVVSILFLAGVIVDHLLATISIVTKTLDCSMEVDVFDAYIKDFFYWIFMIGVPYHRIFGCILQIIVFITTIMWNYLDLFIICISLYLSSILNQINKRILKAEGQMLPPSFWKSVREDYCRATSLIQIFDEAINGVTFYSFANNVLFVCLHLFYFVTQGIGINKEKLGPMCSNYPSGPFNGYEHVVYFGYALGFTIGRALAVCLIAAKVNTSSTAAAPALFNVPSASYCEEVQRLIEHLYGNTVALTGMNFFFITKQLVISIAGTIITYELVLMQINAKDLIKY